MTQQEIQAISDRIAREVREEALQRNRDNTRRILVDVILAVTGWSGLEPWAEAAIDSAMNGRPVNLVQLKADIEAWKAAQQGGE